MMYTSCLTVRHASLLPKPRHTSNFLRGGQEAAWKDLTKHGRRKAGVDASLFEHRLEAR